MSAKKRITLRTCAMAMAGAWLDMQITLGKHRDAMKASKEERRRLRFIEQLRKHGRATTPTHTIDVDRAVAERFVREVLSAARTLHPERLLTEMVPGAPRPKPVDAQDALVEIAHELRDALGRKGAPKADIDPLQAYEANERFKQITLHGPRSRDDPTAYNKTAVGRVADKFGRVEGEEAIPLSINTVEKAIAEGRGLAHALGVFKREALPPGHGIKFVYVDYDKPFALVFTRKRSTV